MDRQNTRPTGTVMDKFKTAILAPGTRNYLGTILPASVAKYLTPDRMARVALATISRTPALWQCKPESIVRAIVDAASVGLEPTGGVLAHGYLVPYGQECQFIIGYQGLVELARRSGNFEHLEANPVFAKDKLTLRYGFNADFSHEPYMGEGERGPMVGAYCLALFKGGERHVTYMTKGDIDKRRAASKAGSSGPWKQWYEEMAIKTVIKKAAKLWPKTVEIADALDKDERAENFEAMPVFDAIGLDEAPAPILAPAANTRSDQLVEKIKASEKAANEVQAAANEYVADAKADAEAEEVPWAKYAEAPAPDVDKAS